MKTKNTTLSSKNCHTWLRVLILIAITVLTAGSANAQRNRNYIKDAIREWGSCRNVAITKTNGDLALYGHNGCARSGVPSDLDRAIIELNSDGEYIDDIVLTESGRWLILYGDNGFRWNDIPYDLERKLREYNDNGEVVLSVTFNDSDDWVIITRDLYCASHSNMTDWLKDGSNQYGMLWAACVTDDAVVAVYENGYRFLGNVPDDLQRALRTSDLDVYRLKIAGTAWFFADTNGSYHYNM